MVVPSHHTWMIETNDKKRWWPSCMPSTISEGIWNNYIDIQQKIMQVRFNRFLATWGYNSLGDPTRQTVSMVVPSHHIWIIETNDGKKIATVVHAIHMLAFIFANSEVIWNNYIDIQQKIMQVRFNSFLATWGYKFLGYMTRQDEVWLKIVLNTNSLYLYEAFESIWKHAYTIPSD